MRANFRPSASAIDWPRLVLPTPGGPRKQRIGAVSLRIQFAHGEIFDEATFHFLEIVMIAIENSLCFIEIDDCRR